MLLQKETLSLPDIVDTLGQRPFPLKKNMMDYLHELRERDAAKEEASEATAETEAKESEDSATSDDEAEKETEKEQVDSTKSKEDAK